MILNWIDKFETALYSISLWALVIVCFLQVVMRYVFNHALSWPEEVMRYFLICLVFIGISSVMKIDGHLKVKIITSFLSKKAIFIIDTITSIIVIIFFIYTIWLGIEMTMLIKEIEQTAQSFEFPLWISWLPIPIGFSLSIIQLIRCQYAAWENYKKESK